MLAQGDGETHSTSQILVRRKNNMNNAKLIIVCDYSGTKFFIMTPEEKKPIQISDLETAKDELNYLGYYDFEVDTRVRFTY